MKPSMKFFIKACPFFLIYLSLSFSSLQHEDDLEGGDLFLERRWKKFEEF